MKSSMTSGWRGKAAMWLGCALAILLITVPAFSQGNAGRIMGTVTDQSGGTVAGATVTVVDVARGVTRTLTTDDAGEYNAPNLTPGMYTVRAEAKGFKKLERQNVEIQVGKEVRVDLTVQPGEQAQTVTVTEAVPLVETTNATLGGTLDNADIVDMPLNGRDYQNLLALRPGVMNQVGGGPWTQSTNGVRPDESVWMIDGVINHNFFDARPIAGMPSPITDGATILPIDSIQEFNLMENPKAEYGWDPGAVVNVGIRSGSNNFHGTVYGFYRSSNWDARNYFNVVTGPGGVCPYASCDQPPTQLKQYGASVGGPIIKDKLFFFGNYEGLNDLIGNAFGTPGVPITGASGTGTTFSSLATALAGVVNSGGIPSTVSENAAGCTVTGTAPTATANCTGGLYFPASTTGNYLSTIPNINNSYNGVGKIDYHINDKNTLNGVLIVGNYVGNGEDRGFINQIFSNGFDIYTWTTSGTWDYTPNSNMVNEVRFGYNRMTFLTTSGDAGLSVPGLNTGLVVPGLPTLQIGKDAGGDLFALAGTWHNRPQAIAPNPYWDVQDSLSYLVGKHSLKFGGEYTNIEADSYIPDYGRGRVNFPNLTDFFLGITNSGNGKAGKALVGDPTRRLLNTYMAGFVQDDWRLSPRFTLNVGLRYEYASPLKDSNNGWANFNPNSVTGLVQQGSPGASTMWNPNRGNFSPRIGFAYDVNGKGTTVVRGGFSVMYSSFTAVEWMNQNQFQNSSAVSLAANPTAANFITCTGSCLTPLTGTAPNVLVGAGSIAVAANAFSASQLCWDPALASCTTAGQTTVFPKSAVVTCGDKVTPGNPAFPKDPGQCAIMGVDPNLKTPYVTNYSLGITHAFGDNLSLEVGYVGNSGSRLTGFADINQQAPSASGNGLRPFGNQFPWFSYINYMTNDTRSNYNSMQATLTKRMSHGLSFTAGYTYAHGLDNGSLNRFALLPQNANNPGAEYGNSDFDVRHRLTITGTYNIPGVKGFAQMLEGWQINAVATIQSAQPWTVNDYNNNFTGTGDSADHWDFFGNPSDFKGTQISIPYCTGPGAGGCSNVSSVYGNNLCGNAPGTGPNGTCDAATSTAMWTRCMTVQAANPQSQLGGGCFISGSSVMLGPANGTFGTMARNIFRDSGYTNLDFSVFKNFKFKERYGVQLRAEIFNIFNHPVIENPYGASNGSSGGNNDPSTPGAFGGSSGTPDVVAGNPVVGSGDSRAIQVGLKLSF